MTVRGRPVAPVFGDVPRPSGPVGLSSRASLCSAAPLTAAPYFRPFVAPYEDSFACRAVLLRPDSRGQITLASRDPKQAPRIKQNFLAREKDWVTLRAGVKLARDIGRQSALAPFMAAETGPGPDRRSDSEVDAYIRATAITVHHPLGTCKMGTTVTRMPLSTPNAGCAVSRGCGSSMPRSCRISSVATSTRRSS